ncbi:MAG: hypothetical protein QE285_06615 [Aquabacterium sp.]|nr:hypothetical protein [Aquabacterium sp.]
MHEARTAGELLIPFGSSGYVALFEIDDAANLTVFAVRDQCEDDDHCPASEATLCPRFAAVGDLRLAM